MSEGLRTPLVIVFVLAFVSWLTLNTMKGMHNEREIGSVQVSLDALKTAMRDQQ